MEVVEVKGLSKSFGRQRVLDGIDLTAAERETVAVLGRSGTGKSVLLKLMVGLQAADSGAIRVCGHAIGDLAPRELAEVRKKVGFLFQQAALYDSLTVGENVEFPLARHTDLSDVDRRNKARELLSGVGLEKDLDKLPAEISGGMQKRVGLARALALDPELLLLDEPTAGLDPITAAEIGALINTLKQKRQIASVIVTHDVEGARSFADRLILLHKGRVAIEGTFDDLLASRDPFVSQFLRAQKSGAQKGQKGES
jgi:phospholipid/cholesterol/gamma-HCH transport system ATP-binding protein